MTVDVAALEEQREFLLRSLEDLERERAAGDVDDHDYLALRDDYTARAAAVLRELDVGRAEPSDSQPTSPRRTVAVIAAVVVFAIGAGVLVAQTAGRRDAGDTATGGIRQSVTEKLNEAGRRAGEGDLDAAVALYDEVLEDDPAHAEALTYKGWLTTLDGDTAAGLELLLEAATSNPTYPDVHAFLAIVFYRNGLVDEAARELERLDDLDPPAVIRELTEDLRAQVAAARSATSTTVPG